MYIFGGGLDPWLLNKNNQTPFDLLDPSTNSKIYIESLQVWTILTFNEILIVDTVTTSNPSTYHILDKIRYNLDESTSKSYLNIISCYL